jgi:hypothetical protein
MLKRRATMSTHSEDQKRTIAKDALEHAWGWFALHARQRMHCVNFFFVAVAFLATGYVTALTKEFRGLAVGISALGVLISWLFHRLDNRTRELVQAGEDAMKPFQHRLAEAAGVGSLEIVKRVDSPGKKWTSYGEVLWMLHWMTLLAFVAGALYALYVAGVRFCFLDA